MRVLTRKHIRWPVWVAVWTWIATVGLCGCCTAPSTLKDLPAVLVGLKPDGWRISGQVLQFTPENLYEHIDGRAELFLAYDVVSLTYVAFQRGEDPSDPFITLSVYDMGTPTRAFGIFSMERLPGDQPVNLGRLAFSSEGGLFVWKGRYYTQVIFPASDKDATQTAQDCAQRLVNALSDAGEPVWGLTALPTKDRVPGTERYFLVNAMGLDFMRDTYMAQYNKGGVAIDAFLSRHEAPATMARYGAYASQYGKGAEWVNEKGGAFLVCDMGGSFDVVFQKGVLIGGVTAVPDRTSALEAATDLWRELRD